MYNISFEIEMLLTRTIQYSQKQMFMAKNDDGCLHLNGNVRQVTTDKWQVTSDKWQVVAGTTSRKSGNEGERDNLQFCIQIYYSIFIKVIPTFQYVE